MASRGSCTTIVRYSIADALATVREGGCIQPRGDNGHAEVWNKDDCCVGYLTTKDYRRFRDAPTSTRTPA